MTPEEEVVFLRAKLEAVHDHLHHGRVDEAHVACHCEDAPAADEPVPGQNVSMTHAAKLTEFAKWFNEKARGLDLMACWVCFVPSATKKDFFSTQIGGNVGAIQQVRHLMGHGPTIAAGGRTVSRNDPCPCRSGRKYKHCCGKTP